MRPVLALLLFAAVSGCSEDASWPLECTAGPYETVQPAAERSFVAAVSDARGGWAAYSGQDGLRFVHFAPDGSVLESSAPLTGAGLVVELAVHDEGVAAISSPLEEPLAFIRFVGAGTPTKVALTDTSGWTPRAFFARGSGFVLVQQNRSSEVRAVRLSQDGDELDRVPMAQLDDGPAELLALIPDGDGYLAIFANPEAGTVLVRLAEDMTIVSRTTLSSSTPPHYGGVDLLRVGDAVWTAIGSGGVVRLRRVMGDQVDSTVTMTARPGRVISTSQLEPFGDDIALMWTEYREVTQGNAGDALAVAVLDADGFARSATTYLPTDRFIGAQMMVGAGQIFVFDEGDSERRSLRRVTCTAPSE